MNGPLYWHPRLYQLGLRLLYGRYYQARYEAAVQYIQPGESVLDVCAGDCALYRGWLRQKAVDYRAVDGLPHFVKWAQGRGIQAQLLTLPDDELPPADTVVMLGSLYQFLPQPQPVLDRLIQSARKRVILTEPVRNWAQCRSPWLRQMADWGTAVKGKRFPARFSEESLRATLQSHGFQTIIPIANQRELLAIRKK